MENKKFYKSYKKPFENSQRRQPETMSSDTVNPATNSATPLLPAAASNIIRPLLTQIDWTSIHKFDQEWNKYVFQVKASAMEDRKKREALNITASISELVLELLILWELPAFGILRPATKEVTAEQATEETPQQKAEIERPYRLEELEASIIERWLQAKLQQRSEQRHVLELKDKLRQELFMRGSGYWFSYVPGQGSLREQLRVYTAKLGLNFKRSGLNQALSEMEKISLWLKLLRPWQTAKHAVLWIANPEYIFHTPGITNISMLLKNSLNFFDEAIEVIASSLAPTIAMAPDALNSLSATSLTSDEETLVGEALARCLREGKEQALAKRVRRLEEQVMSKRTRMIQPPFKRMHLETRKSKHVRTIPSRAPGKKAQFWKSRKVQEVEASSGSGEEYNEADDMQEEQGLEELSDDASMHETEGIRASYIDSDSNSLADCGEEEVERVAMKVMQAREQLAKACSNCNQPNCFSNRCPQPCKFCKKERCNSWVCFERPAGYGSAKAPSRATLSERRTSAFKRNQEVWEYRRVVTEEIPNVKSEILFALDQKGYSLGNVLVDPGSQGCSVTTKLIEKMEAEGYGKLPIRNLKTKVVAEFATTKCSLDCTQGTTVPFLRMHVSADKALTLANLDCVVLDSDREEFIIGNRFLITVLGANVLDLLRRLDSNVLYDGHLHPETMVLMNADWEMDPLSQTFKKLNFDPAPEMQEMRSLLEMGELLGDRGY